MNSDITLLAGLLVAVVPLTFAMIWLLVTAILGTVSGWHRLQRAFPDRDEAPIERLRMQSGSVGPVRFNNCLRFDVCATGLRLAVSRFLGPFLRPVLVPWGSVFAEQHRVLFGEVYRLRFGMPEQGRLLVAKATASRIASIAPLRLPPD